MTTLLIDADILVFRSAYAGSSRHYVYKDTTTGALDNTDLFDSKADITSHFNAMYQGATPDEVGVEFHCVTTFQQLGNCIDALEWEIKKIHAAFSGVASTEYYLTGKGNYRDAAAVTQPYKAGRPPKPEHYLAIREYMIKNYGAIVVDGMEADDMLGIRQTQDPNEDTVIVSIDKDLLMVPGKHYDWVKDVHKTVTEGEGIRHFWKQMLTGDSVDNIKGLKGIGPKRADGILSNVEDYSTTVLDAYLQHTQYDTEEQARDHYLENVVLLWIQQHDLEYLDNEV